MRIRDAQFQVFQEKADDSFVTSVAQYLREEHSDVLVKLPSVSTPLNHLPVEFLEQLVQRAISAAHVYGITWQSSLAAFVVLTFVIAPNFNEHGYISQVLEDPSVAPDMRIDELWERTSDRTWHESIENYDAAAWNADFIESKQSWQVLDLAK